MIPTSQDLHSRRNVRVGLAVLCGITGLALVQVLFIPHQPPLPLPPDASALPPPWTTASQSTNGQALDIGFLQSRVALGASQHFSQNGSWLILTPVATWQLKELHLANITKGKSSVRLKNPKLLTIEPERYQIALGRINGASVAQTCLTRQGTMAFSASELIRLSRHPDLGFLAKAIGSLRPSDKRGYNCLLVTTNRPEVLKGTQERSDLIASLLKMTRWR
jgi:hypothetical protein